MSSFNFRAQGPLRVDDFAAVWEVAGPRPLRSRRSPMVLDLAFAQRIAELLTGETPAQEASLRAGFRWVPEGTPSEPRWVQLRTCLRPSGDLVIETGAVVRGVFACHVLVCAFYAPAPSSDEEMGSWLRLARAARAADEALWWEMESRVLLSCADVSVDGELEALARQHAAAARDRALAIEVFASLLPELAPAAEL